MVRPKSDTEQQPEVTIVDNPNRPHPTGRRSARSAPLRVDCTLIRPPAHGLNAKPVDETGAGVPENGSRVKDAGTADRSPTSR